METTLGTTPTLALLTDQYAYSLTTNSHFRQMGTVNHPMLAPFIKLGIPIDRTHFPKTHLAATAKSLQRPCLWYSTLHRTRATGLYYTVLTEGEGSYYLFFWFPAVKKRQLALVDIHWPFHLLVVELTETTPKPRILWPQIVKHLKTLPPLINS